MGDSLIFWIQSIIVPWGMWGIFVGSVLEELIAFIPSLFMQLSYGFLLYANTPMTFQTVALFFITMPVVAALGVVVGSLPYFFIAKFLGKVFIDRYGRFIGIGKNTRAKIEKYLEKSSFDEAFMLYGRLIPMMPSVLIAVLPGFFGVKLKNYMFYSFIGAYIRCAVLGFIGWQLGQSYLKYVEKINSLGDFWGPIIFVLCIAATVFYTRYEFKKIKLD